MPVPAGIVIGLADSVETAAAVLAAWVALAGAAEAVIVAGFAEGALAAGAWDAVDAVWLGVEAGIAGAAGGCGAPIGEEGGAA